MRIVDSNKDVTQDTVFLRSRIDEDGDYVVEIARTPNSLYERMVFFTFKNGSLLRF